MRFFFFWCREYAGIFLGLYLVLYFFCFCFLFFFFCPILYTKKKHTLLGAPTNVFDKLFNAKKTQTTNNSQFLPQHSHSHSHTHLTTLFFGGSFFFDVNLVLFFSNFFLRGFFVGFFFAFRYDLFGLLLLLLRKTHTLNARRTKYNTAESENCKGLTPQRI